MESIIKWQTGEPKESYCCCIVTLSSGFIRPAVWLESKGWMTTSLFHKLNVVAWCDIKDIEPYKEEEV